jgi:hypothetical protein
MAAKTKLSTYRSKRNFAKTAEPSGTVEISVSNQMTRSRLDSTTHPAQRDYPLAPHRLTDDRKSFLSDRLVRGDVVWAVEIAFADLAARDKASISMGIALNGDRVEFFVVDHGIAVFGVFVATALFVGLDRVAGHLVQLLAKAVAGLFVDLAEGDALTRRRSGVKRDGAGNEGELEVALLYGRGTAWETATQTQPHGSVYRWRIASTKMRSLRRRRPRKARRRYRRW